MLKLVTASMFSVGLLGIMAACTSDVLVVSGEDARAGGSDGELNLRCYQECIRKGSSEAECTEYCWFEGDGEDATKPGSGKPGSGSGPDYDDDDDDDDDEKEGEGYKGEAERNCLECLKENSGGACATEYEACEKSLACTMLAQCPYECWGDDDCIEQCNNIIPSGVETLEELLECMMCSPYTPCAEDCEGSSLNNYCGD